MTTELRGRIKELTAIAKDNAEFITSLYAEGRIIKNDELLRVRTILMDYRVKSETVEAAQIIEADRRETETSTD